MVSPVGYQKPTKTTSLDPLAYIKHKRRIKFYISQETLWVITHKINF